MKTKKQNLSIREVAEVVFQDVASDLGMQDPNDPVFIDYIGDYLIDKFLATC